MKKLMYAAVAIAAIVVDRLVKAWAAGPLKAGGSTLDLIPGVFGFTYVENYGAAFGILQGQRVLFLVLTTVVALAFIYKLFISNKTLPTLPSIGLTLLLGGAVGNLIDRAMYGFVVDMFDFYLIQFAVFNVADSCVVVGVILLAVWLLFIEPKTAAEAKANAMDKEPSSGDI